MHPNVVYLRSVVRRNRAAASSHGAPYYLFAHQERKICLANHKLIYPEIQGEFVANQRVLAGHFRWGELVLRDMRSMNRHVQAIR